jgi:prefoldin subunit 5
MSKLTRLQTKLTTIDARIAEIEAVYPTIVQYKSYSHNFGEIQTAYQEFGPVAREYRQLLSDKDVIEDQIEELQATESGVSSVANFTR